MLARADHSGYVRKRVSGESSNKKAWTAASLGPQHPAAKPAPTTGATPIAQIRPFRGLRYDPGRVQPNDVIAPPYDVVGADAEAKLLARSPHNAAHIELAPIPADGPIEGRFQRAAAALATWQTEGILTRDETPRYYLYEQDALIEGQRHTRRCFFAALRLSPPEDGIIRPHESTMAGPRAIRLDLMRATNANISPIFAMFNDPQHHASNTLNQIATTTPPAFEATDDLGDHHRLWPIQDPADVETLTTSIHMSTITIADGHHRTTTALDYQAEQRTAAGAAWDQEAAANYVLTGLIAADDPGLVILPNHRLVTAPPPPDLVDRLAEHFDVTDLTAELPSGPNGAAALLARVRQLAEGPATLGIIDANGPSNSPRLLLAVGRAQDALDDAMPANLSTASKRLDALVLTELVLAPLFNIDGAALAAGAVDFAADATEAYSLTADGPYSIAFLVNGTPVQQVIDVADAGEVMPQKTTFYYPKLATGMVFNLLDERAL